ncbi:J domain-containing protein [Bradyrhizobium sp. CB1650]|uniref:J domain-containing protein n=1 Tax=Bradyrhizobium sp. CB1650 TaxID=3039153 RepID=UPI0024359BB4|nr:J domain-containing protein [Bradyrhizobium sp. CB1650]WGD53766.1 J domain-containing protein [Bradyrhizobium sp. CB1650]
MHPVIIFIVLAAILFVLALPYLASLSLYSLPVAVAWWLSKIPKGDGPKLADIPDEAGDAILERFKEQKRAAEAHVQSERRRGRAANVRFIEREDRFENRSNLGQGLNRSIEAGLAEIEELDEHIERLADPGLRRFLAWRNDYIAWCELGRYRGAVLGAVLGTIAGLVVLEVFDAAPSTVFVPNFIGPTIVYSLLFGWVGALLGLFLGRRHLATRAEAEIEAMEAAADDTQTEEHIVAATMPDEDWHEILGVAADASNDDIRQAYKAAIRRSHPDFVANMSENIQQAAVGETQRINDAYRRAKELRGF